MGSSRVVAEGRVSALAVDLTRVEIEFGDGAPLAYEWAPSMLELSFDSDVDFFSMRNESRVFECEFKRQGLGFSACNRKNCG